jgi:uracil-DNA glycosylase family protein
MSPPQGCCHVWQIRARAESHGVDESEPKGTGSARDFIPDDRSLPTLSAAVQRCRGCGLYAFATQAVFGQGPRKAELMLVGEQPGDREDVAGAPFVGPAGQLLDRALLAAGIDRSKVYVTNIVKHFKWKHGPVPVQSTGKRRLHDKPNAYEVSACKPWLEEEVRNVQPKIVVCLGATAAQGLLGDAFRVTRQRGEFFESDLASFITATVHPSSILRAADEASRQNEMAAFIADLERVAIKLEELGSRD